ncbi:hypothetical protein INT44_000591 [Umbelopsis vinacea]|uniref:Uncharacterized protein n=1 Tax=Umbelopsis vinacea TaxID=44442 RepID=A0A8H7Q8N2_9FUNG|nr:hypothetical protein INT44_000591 [Umbelopsis vinacea]
MNTSSTNHVNHSTLLSQPYNPLTRTSYSNQPTFNFHSAGNSASRMDLALGPPSAPSQPPNSIFPPFEHSLKSVNIGDWVARKKPVDPKRNSMNLTSPSPFLIKTASITDDNDNSWRDVYRNIKCMDQLYDATFYSWLKSEDNVLVTAVYLHRIANEYPLFRIINALKWLISDWRLESISILVRHVTVDWKDEVGDLRRAHLLRHLTHSWATQYTATLITTILATPPYMSSTNQQRERFLRAFAQDWDFSKLSEFFMYLQSRANVDYKVKCVMLQEAARRERETLGAKLNKKRGATTSALIPDYRKADIGLHDDVSPTTGADKEVISMITAEKMRAANLDTTTDSKVVTPAPSSLENAEETTQPRRHHRRTSSNDVTDIKRLRLSTPNFENGNEESSNTTPLSSSASSLGRINSANVASSVPSTSPTAITATINTRRAATPDHRSSSSTFNCELPSSSQSSRSVRHGIPSDINSSPSTPSQRSPTSSTVTSSTATFPRHHHHYHPYASSAHSPISQATRRRSSSGASTSSTTVASSEVVTSRVDEECDMDDMATSKRRALI